MFQRVGHCRERICASLAAVLAAVVLLAASPTSARAQTIDTTGSWNGTDFIAPWGVSDTSTYGQTVTAPAGKLNSFTFYIRDSGVAISYQAYVYKWDSGLGRVTGPALFTSAVMTTPSTGSAAFVATSFATGGTPMVAGNKYALFLTTAGVAQGLNSGTTVWGLAQPSSQAPYPGGSFIYYNTGPSFAPLLNSTWNCTDPCFFGDLAFIAQFGPAANFTAVAQTANQLSVATALQTVADSNPAGNANTIITTLSNLDAAGQRAGFDALSGEGTAGAQTAAFLATSLFMKAVAEHAAYACDQDCDGAALEGFIFGGGSGPSYLGAADRSGARPSSNSAAGRAPKTWRLWTAGFGGAERIDGSFSPGTADVHAHAAGMAAGIDARVSGTLIVGVTGGGATSGFSVGERMTSGSAQSAHGGIYAVHRSGPLMLTATVDYGHFDIDATRTIAGIGATEIATGAFHAHSLSARLEAGWRIPAGSGEVTPFVAIEPARLWTAGYAETSTTLTGAPGILANSYADHGSTSLPLYLGARYGTRAALGGDLVLKPYVKAAWVHEFKPSRSIESSIVALSGPAFTIEGARAARNAVQLSGGAKLDIAPGVGLYAGFEGEFSGESQLYSGTGGVRLSW